MILLGAYAARNGGTAHMTYESSIQFTRFLLDNYLSTDEGIQALEFFKNLAHLVKSGDPNRQIDSFVNKLLLQPLYEVFFSISRDVSDENWDCVTYEDIDHFENDLRSFFDSQVTEYKLSYREMLEEIPQYSLFFFSASQQFAFPYLYPVHFFKVDEICNKLGIIIPKLPGRTQYKEKCLYYIELCKVFYAFRQKHGLSAEEFCVLFYSFTPHLLQDFTATELPLPLKVYISGANKEHDHEYIENISTDSVSYWQGSTETEQGDVILLYELSPYSRISSIWRAITPGYADPFRYYPGVIWVGAPVAIPPISLDELKADPVWSNKGLVRANMQGVSGRPCSREEYEALLHMLQKKDFDISLLPPLPQFSETIDISLSNERDVEEHLLEPFLKRIGLTEKDWMRQMPIRMGRGIRYYPDYVIQPNSRRGDESGSFICEAKYRIANNNQLAEDFNQAKSYALRLNSKGFMLASCEGIWLSYAKDAYQFEKKNFFSWIELTHPDVLHKINMDIAGLLKQ
jgi:hypothetical protein